MRCTSVSFLDEEDCCQAEHLLHNFLQYEYKKNKTRCPKSEEGNAIGKLHKTPIQNKLSPENNEKNYCQQLNEFSKVVYSQVNILQTFW